MMKLLPAYRTVRVATLPPYQVMIGNGLVRRARDLLAAAGVHMAPSSAVVVTSEKVAGLWLAGLTVGLGDALRAVVLIGDGEQRKTLATLAEIYDALIERQCDRDTVLLTLGGGVVGDIGGLAAATYMRGIRLVHVPTTLLAQVDASVGGKVAVDHPRGKNLIGSFYQPRAVLCDLATLATLPDEIYRDGLAEVVKTALVGGEALLASLEGLATNLAARDVASLEEVVLRCLQVKASLVSADERDTDQRMALNLGHTFAHALEAAGGFNAVSHGRAVAVGLCLAGQLAAAAGLASRELLDRTQGLLRRVGLPVAIADVLPGHESATSQLSLYLGQDKKRRGGELRFVLARAPGDVIVASGIPADLVQLVLDPTAKV